MIKNSPCPVDVQELQFKLKCKLKIFNNTALETFPNSSNLLSCASRYGLLFIGTNSNILQVLQIKSLEDYSPKDKEITNYPRRVVPLPSRPTHVCVNCDSTILAVVIEKDKCPHVLFYNIPSFLRQTVTLIKDVRLSATPNTFATEVNWNPTIPTLFTACKSDGTLGLYELKDTTVDINELPAAAAATCFCWSPRGKQVAVGSKDGKITQYKPDLKAARIINSPNLSKPHSLISLQWISNFQFIGVYLSNEGAASVIVVDAPKAGEIVYTNYDDICYSGSSRYAQFYTLLLSQWGILMAASSNATEVGVLGSSGDTWTQWIMNDTARAELPLSSNHEDTLPVGFTLDTSSTAQLPWGEGTIPPTPFLFVLSHHGVLCMFNMVYLKEGLPSICSPPEPLPDMTGLQFFTTDEPKPAPPTQSFTPQPAGFVIPKPTQTPPTLTPVTPTSTQLKPQTSQPITLFGGQATITPISKEKAASPFGGMYSAGTTATPTKPTANPVVYVTPENKVPQSPIEQIPIDKTPTKSDNLPNQGEIDAMIAKLIKEEFNLLETQVNVLLQQAASLKINIGTDSEKVDLIQKIESLETFLKDLSDINAGQSAEVHCLKQNLIQSWAWYEEANSKYVASKDETMTLLLRAEPLDMASEKHLKNIQHSVYYLDSQLSQASRALDEQWDNFQDYAKKSHRTQMPTMEAIFQTMVSQNAILQKQRYILKDISSRLRNKSRSTGFNLLMAGKGTKELQEDMKRLQLDAKDLSQMQYERILHRNKLLNKCKVEKMRQILTGREVMHVTAIKPQLSSSILQQSPASKSKHLISILGAQMSPVAKNVPVKVLDFVQSTPKPETRNEQTAPRSSTFLPVTKGMSDFQTQHPTTASTGLKFSSTKPQFVGNVETSRSNVMSSTFLPVTKGSSSSNFAVSQPQTSVSSGLKFATSKPQLTPSVTPTTVASSSVFAFVASGSATTTPVSKPSTSLFGNASASKSISSFSFTTVPSATAEPTKGIFNFGSKPLEAVTPSISTASTVKVTESGNKSPSIFGNVSSSVTTKSIVFGTGNSIFSAPLSSMSTKTSETEQTFSVTSSVAQSSSVSSTVTSKSPFSGTTSIFGGGVTIQPITKPSIFSNVSLESSKSSIFGTASTISSTSSFSVPSTGSLDKTSSSISVTKPAEIKVSVGTTSSADSSVLKPADSGTKSIFGIPIAAQTTPTSAKGSEPSTPTTSPFEQTSPLSLTTTSASLLSHLPTSFASGSIFGGSTAQSAATTAPPSIFAQPSIASVATTSLIGQSAAATPVASAKTPTFAQSVSVTPTATTASSLFGSSLPTAPVTTTTTKIFGATTATPSTTSVFAQPLSTPATSTSIFGQAQSNTLPASSTTSIFGVVSSSQAAAVTTASIFGQTSSPPTAAPADSSTPSIFGQATSISGTPSIFGQAANATSTTTSIFGQSAVTSQAVTTSGSIVGQQSAVTSQAVTSSGSIFGNSPSIFGGTQATSKPSIFAAAPVASTPSPAFGATSTADSGAGIFGAKTTSIFSGFGGTTTTASSPFGGSAPAFGTPSTTASIFGQPAPFGAGSASVFGGTSQPTTSSSIFGQTSTPSVFGDGSKSPTAGTVFGGSSPSSAFGGNSFGMNATTAGSIFGATPAQSFSFTTSSQSTNLSFGGLSMGGGASTASTGAFGGGFTETTASNPFAKAPTMSTQQSSIFGTPTTSNATSIFGSSAASQGFGTPTFGSPTGFGQQQPVFGQSTFGGSPSFGSPQPGPFSGGSGGVAQAGFGAAATFQKPSGFGSPPSFGSASPTFGSAPTFGGAPAFGTSTGFGSPQKVFGSGGSSFGNTPAQQQSPSFGNLANQNTVGFGSLAQQASNPNSNSGFTGSSSFSTWR